MHWLNLPGLRWLTSSAWKILRVIKIITILITKMVTTFIMIITVL